MTPRKHAEVIKAWADGAQVQILNTAHGEWADTNYPDFYPDQQYRIKPEPKPDVVRYVNVYFNNGYSTIGIANSNATPSRNGTVRYVIDGETGMLKSAEVV